jgi:hypothetical protein
MFPSAGSRWWGFTRKVIELLTAGAKLKDKQLAQQREHERQGRRGLGGISVDVSFLFWWGRRRERKLMMAGIRIQCCRHHGITDSETFSFWKGKQGCANPRSPTKKLTDYILSIRFKQLAPIACAFASPPGETQTGTVKCAGGRIFNRRP